ncbi:hypothetical protein VNO78_34201 [Psophocarpus tetragonolobus]|uniref:F-box domain-containing protein n=1 Tax=Psophocarpus tetragonolobus TaxID=3891 RepID=A0AAN9RKH9_PSOTE
MERENCKGELLPWELITEISLRLPVKSLVRFKCVCKSWFSLISDPNFAKSHFELAAKVTERIVLLAPLALEFISIDFKASLYDDSASVALKLDTLLYPRYSISILGSCRGFLLLKSYDSLWVWNPSTGVHKQVPFSPVFNLSSMFSTFLFGFGYDPSKDDYLVVLASYNPNSIDFPTRVECFSIRANEWKEIESVHLPYMSCFDYIEVGSLLNDAIHWLAFSFDGLRNVIVAFDLRERRFTEVPWPIDFECDFNFCDLRVFREFLSLCVAKCSRPTEIWIMEEYKVQPSWTKIIHVSIDDIPTRYFSLICSTESGDIVGTDGSTGLVKCNDHGQLLEHQSYCNGPCGSQPQVAMYTESLLSLPYGSERHEEDD